MSVSRRTRAAITGGLTVLSGGGAYEVQIQVATAKGSTKTWEITLGVLLAVVTAALPTYEQWRQVRQRRTAEYLATAAQSDLRVAMADVLEPLTALLGSIHKAHGPAQVELKGNAVQMVLNSAAGMVDTQRARACFFRNEPGPPRRLRPEKWAGRSGRPHTEFEAGRPDGDAALTMVRERERRYCPDVDPDPPPGWSGTTSGYRTFVAVPVYAGDECFGMLTVDALAPGDLATEAESGLVDVFAHLLGVILSA